VPATKAPGPPKQPSASELIELALKAGFVELAYGMLVIAIAAVGLAAASTGKTTPYIAFQYAMAALGVLGAVYILIDVTRRVFFLGAPNPSPSA
jgi:hypothetical protein